MGLIMQNGISYGGVDIVKLTQAEYDALPESKNSDGILYAITDGESSSGGTSKPVELTKAQYEALGESTKTDGILYAITDGDELSAKNLEYDGSQTGLGNNVQGAIDKLNSNIDAKIGFTWVTDVFDVTANVERSYVFQNLPEHKISFPILCEVTKQMQGVVISRDIDTAGSVRMFSPVTQQIRIVLIVLI